MQNQLTTSQRIIKGRVEAHFSIWDCWLEPSSIILYCSNTFSAILLLVLISVQGRNLFLVIIVFFLENSKDRLERSSFLHHGQWTDKYFLRAFCFLLLLKELGTRAWTFHRIRYDLLCNVFICPVLNPPCYRRN